MIIIHIVIALISIFTSSYCAYNPSTRKINISIGLIFGTLLSGALLLFSGGSIVKICKSGALYLIYTTSLTFIAKKRLQVALP